MKTCAKMKKLSSLLIVQSVKKKTNKDGYKKREALMLLFF